MSSERDAIPQEEEFRLVPKRRQQKVTDPPAGQEAGPPIEPLGLRQPEPPGVPQELSPGTTEPTLAAVDTDVRPVVVDAGKADDERGQERDAAFPEPLTYDDPKLSSEPRGLPNLSTPVPDTILDGAALAGLTIRGASIRGDDHRFYAQPRQDSMGIWELRTGDAEKAGAVLVCVADGVGSQPHSQLGSAAACQILSDLLRTEYPTVLDPSFAPRVPGYAEGLVSRLSDRLTTLAAEWRQEPKSVSTTLVAALIEAEPADPAHRRCLLFKVGDSPALLLRQGGFEHCFTGPVDEVIASTATHALPARFPQVETMELRLGADDILVLCSDGLSGPMHNRAVTAQLVAFWGNGQIPSLPEFCWQLAFRAKSYGDDRTAVCVWGR
ncbi:protein phosphatase 2C domain-containing protein [Actinomadura rubrisoli]|nr:protein phosphatase 2C domain-containing protein [Actinomadura rubrisoli]